MSGMIAQVVTFMKRYNMKVVGQSYRPMVTNMPCFFTEVDDKNHFSVAPEITTERLFTVQVTEESIRRIAQFEQAFYASSDPNRRVTFTNIMDSHQAEKALREQHPVLKAAYKEYCTILHLCNQGSVTHYKKEDNE